MGNFSTINQHCISKLDRLKKDSRIKNFHNPAPRLRIEKSTFLCLREERVMMILFYGIIIFVLFIDQVSKYWIRATLPVGETIEVWEGVLHFTQIENTGAAFGLFEGFGRLFVPIAIAVLIVGIYLFKNNHLTGKCLEIGVALFVGGAMGNAIDRVLFNKVTDFINFQINDGIPNLADYALFLGMFFILVEVIILEPIRKRKTAERLSSVEEGPAE